MVQKKYDVTALGELLIDFTENGTSSQGNRLLEARQCRKGRSYLWLVKIFMMLQSGMLSIHMMISVK